MKSKILLILTVLMIFLWSSCGYRKSFNSDNDLIDYLENPSNGYKKVKSLNGVKVGVVYKPTDLLVAQFQPTNKLSLDNLRESYEDKLFFNLSISKNNSPVLSSASQGRSSYGRLVKELSFDLGTKIYLQTSSNVEFELLDYSISRNYGIGNADNILLVFEKPKRLADMKSIVLIIPDFGMATGEVRFSFDSKKIINQPFLEFLNIPS